MMERKSAMTENESTIRERGCIGTVVELVDTLRSAGLECKAVEYTVDFGSMRITCKADVELDLSARTRVSR
jgi:hypothetical protein